MCVPRTTKLLKEKVAFYKKRIEETNDPEIKTMCKWIAFGITYALGASEIGYKLEEKLDNHD